MAMDPAPDEAAFISFRLLDKLIRHLADNGVVRASEINGITRQLIAEWSAAPNKLANDSAKLLGPYIL